MSAPPDILVRGGDRKGLARTVGVSALIHVAAIALLLVAPQRFTRASTPVVSYTVDLVTSDQLAGTNLPAVGKQNAKKAPTTGAMVVKTDKARTRPAKRAPVAKQKKAETKKTSKKPASKPAAPKSVASARPAPGPVRSEAEKRDQAILAAVRRRSEHVRRTESTASAGVSGGPDASGVMSVGPGTGGGGTVRGLEYLLYYNRMMTSIKEGWAWAGQGGVLEAVVGFRITPGGEVVEVRTVQSSGDPSYDLSVERAVRRASPLGAPPDQYRSEFTNGVEITFRAEDLRS